MHSNMSPWEMFLAADPVVQAVMIGLIVASFVVWAVLIWKSIELRASIASVEGALAAARSAAVISVLRRPASPIVAALVEEARGEIEVSRAVQDRAAVKERIGLSLDRLVAAEGRRIGRGIGTLATIGSTAPFVGLFGTVWGIMNSFVGIAESKTTNLAVVAPGIAEALLATACGLIVAIPAVVIYNHFTRAIGGYRALVADAAAVVHRLSSRELDGVAASEPRQNV